MPAYKKWLIAFFSLFLAALVLLGGITVLIDPYFHYHAPLEGLSYNLFYQRYQNDGIVKHFEYDAIITGNSMNENFLASQCDELFGVNSVKVPYSGASLRELSDNIRTALEHNSDVKLVIMGLDYGNFIQDKDHMAYDDSDYPGFLYDSNPFNDVKYLFNKSIFKTSLDFIARTLSGIPPTTFDEYSMWDSATPYGRDTVFTWYTRPWSSGETHHMNEERLALLEGNIRQNVTGLAADYPDVDFYFFFPPYSILFWDKQYCNGVLELQLEAEVETIEMMLEYENIHLFSFLDDFELVNDFSHYKDYIHYDPGINAMILEAMAAGEHRLTKDNYREYCDKIRDYYCSYDYDSLFE